MINKSKFDSISNYNLSYENFLEAINEFDGYILGSSYNDIFLFTNDDIVTKVYREAQMQVENYENEELDNFVKNIASRILDRTTGTYFFRDMFDGNMHDKYFTYITNYMGNSELNRLGQFLHIFPPVKGANRSGLKAFKNNAFVNCVPKIVISGSDEPQQVHMGDHICYYDSPKETIMNAIDTNGNPVYTTDESGTKSIKTYTSDVSPSGEKKVSEINGVTVQQGDRHHTPNLCGMVIRHPKASLSGRNKSHLPIFFNAIPPVEMSRCTPYINIQVLSLNYGEKEERIGNLNQVTYLRFEKNNTSGDFELSDANNFGRVTPVQTSEVILNKSGVDAEYDYSYMDIFTTPQTFSNAKINKESGNFLRNSNINDPVLDPIMPFLSLKNLNVNITGAGYGIMSSKRATLSLVLHDRSRLTDIAPLVSSNQFATTKVIVEYGWSHPEGGVGSNNVIGKYLDALKDRSVFQVVGSKFDFGDGGAVNIDIDLAAYGYRQTERVHAGAGPEVPLNSLQNLIEKAVSDLVKASKKNEQAPEIRQEIKLNSRSARSIESMISWQAYRKIAEDLKSNNTDKILDNLKIILNPESATKDLASIDSELRSIVNKESEKENALRRVFGKLAELESDDSIDGFLISKVFGAQDINLLQSNADFTTESSENVDVTTSEVGKVVSVGKLVSQFVGHPLAATGLYDEVQIVFYPMNHHAAGGRIHTTASFPIPVSIVEEKFLDRIKKNAHLSTKSAFSLIEKLVRDKNLPAYKLTNIYSEKDVLATNDPEKIRFIIQDRLLSGKLDGLGLGSSGTVAESVLDFELFQELELLDNNESSSFDSDAFVKFLNNEEKVKEVQEKIKEKNAEIVEEQKAKVAFEGVTGSVQERAEAELAAAESNAKILKLQAELKVFETELNLAQYSNKRYNEIVKEIKSQVSSEVDTNITNACKAIYESDGLKDLYPAESKFIRPNLAMNFEVLDVISPPGDYEKNYLANLATSLGVDPKRKETSASGFIENKQILRIHIYDEEAVADPTKYAVLNTLVEGASNKIVGGTAYDKVKDYLKGLNFNDVKQIVKRSYPTIIYGAANSTIKTMSVSSNTSGEMANVLMVEAYGNLKNGQVEGYNHENEFDSIVMFPNTVSLSMMGMPMIGRGNSIFIDFGTNTSIDNIYTVKSISHTIGAGNFTSTVSVVPSNMGAISNFKEKLGDAIDKLRS